jgi:prepilin-type N-terminal cleavage/methylation domain-containing protein
VRFFNTNKLPRVRRGLSLVEVMISLAISAMLLTAVAAAFTASSDAIQVNDEFFRASQAARVSMNQILTEIRRANAVSVPSPLTGSPTLSMITHDTKDRTYTYDATNRRLKLITNDVTTDPDYTLASNCAIASFDVDTYTDTLGINHVIRVSVTIVVQVGQNQIRLTGSAAPRKAQTWQ